VVAAGLNAASALVTPFLLSVFIAVLVAPPQNYLRAHGLPGWAAMLVMIALLVGVGGIIVGLFTSSLNQFNASLPDYQIRLKTLSGELITWMDLQGVHVSRDAFNSLVDPSRALRFASELIRGFGGVLTNALMILLTVIFILVEANSLPCKLRVALRSPERSIAHLREVMQIINRYMFIKALTSTATGLLIWLWLRFLGVDYAAMWATLAFLLNFIPTIGSIIAAVPAVLLALVQLGLEAALLATAGYMFVNVVIGNAVEPRVMGRGLGLSTLVVFLSLVFWGHILGPAGMFLSVPLTMALKIALSANSQTRPIAIMLGPEIEARQAASEDAKRAPLIGGQTEPRR
jgi:AI-2 transport protein TqsA